MELVETVTGPVFVALAMKETCCPSVCVNDGSVSTIALPVPPAAPAKDTLLTDGSDVIWSQIKLPWLSLTICL